MLVEKLEKQICYLPTVFSALPPSAPSEDLVLHGAIKLLATEWLIHFFFPSLHMHLL